jgi:acyl-CoA-dependent ceramide synthase
MSFHHSPWRLDYLWIGLPHTPLAAPVKIYYLTQFAFWIHQVLILNAEAHRKDHLQMMAHHVITVGLVFASYALHFNRVGCLVLVLMDFCDIVLATAKMLRYIEQPRSCDIAFVIFLISWFLTRHVGFLLVLASTWFRFPAIIPSMLDGTPDAMFGPIHYYSFNFSLATLQVIMCIWFISIINIAWSVIRGKPAEDVRSDEESVYSSHI